MQNLIFITFDGIQNSVFSGQVIQPLIKRINQNPELKVFIISFEKNYLPQEVISKYIPVNKNLFFLYYRRLPILGKISLYPCIYNLKNFLKKFNSYDLITRGPIAGWVANKAITKECKSFTLQARGLLTEEYQFTHLPQKNILKNIWHTWRKNSLYKIENEAYNIPGILIKSVSYALSEYLIKTYNLNPSNIILELTDIPESITLEQKQEWRLAIRKNLNIANTAQIYCYNGSVKAWQCPELVIEFFKNQLKKEKNIFLLVLSQDKDLFEKLLKKQNINNYLVLTVSHNEIYKYLCASDYGLIFRKSRHIVNWISRPVKAMEYKAVGLKIIHNNTVKWLIEASKAIY